MCAAECRCKSIRSKQNWHTCSTNGCETAKYADVCSVTLFCYAAVQLKPFSSCPGADSILYTSTKPQNKYAYYTHHFSTARLYRSTGEHSYQHQVLFKTAMYMHQRRHATCHMSLADLTVAKLKAPCCQRTNFCEFWYLVHNTCRYPAVNHTELHWASLNPSVTLSVTKYLSVQRVGNTLKNWRSSHKVGLITLFEQTWAAHDARPF